MGVLVPLVAPLAWDLSGHDVHVLTASLGGTLGGAVFGNVSSPLADTSILAAMCCRCEMLQHVTSQATYVALTAAIALLLGALPVGLGVWNIGIALALSLAVLALVPLVVRWCGHGRGSRRLLRVASRRAVPLA